MASIPVGGPLGDPSMCGDVSPRGAVPAAGPAPDGSAASVRDRADGGPGAAGPGLVSLETSVTRPSGGSGNPSQVSEVVEIDRHEARLKRMRRSVQSAAEILQGEARQRRAALEVGDGDLDLCPVGGLGAWAGDRLACGGSASGWRGAMSSVASSGSSN